MTLISNREKNAHYSQFLDEGWPRLILKNSKHDKCKIILTLRQEW